ncbi:lasso RiPP family leader peptide-containing protein [Occultella glacieicola]|jgi:hypothetical protein|uniref:Uncharacterized protein n=3 Tax=Occultella TaxID=2828348 RepID=A0A7M4DI90_9MICO|nr:MULTISPECIES: lasso RiPP family leader peptide-containing protein [Occultella]MBZ2199014.1 lasso RiPP family leader peptide-containing protein [Occultella gossypii]TDE94062.1 lasso RiPP family leader peptide-containing protein [Occultella glacieicola]VZO36656.1 hypothetical protein HALOF300_01841 [Occultella aeris]
MYESPMIQEVGSVRDLTLGEGWAGSDDTFLYFIRYGTDPSS